MIYHVVWDNVPARGEGRITGSFTTHGGNVVIFFTGSAWAPEGGPLSVVLLVDGGGGGNANGFSNEPNSHKALVPSINHLTLQPGEHTVAISPQPGTKVDANDFFTLTVTEYL